MKNQWNRKKLKSKRKINATGSQLLAKINKIYKPSATLAREEAKESFITYMVITFIAMFFGLMLGANIFQLFFMIFPIIIVFTMFKYFICLENNKKVYSSNKQ